LLDRALQALAANPAGEAVAESLRTALGGVAATPIENTVRHENGLWYLARVLPCRRKGRIDGAAITFVDITTQKKIQQDQEDALLYTESIIETVREPLMVLDADLRVVTANRAFYQTFRVSPEEREHRRIYDLGNRQWDIPHLRKLLEDILPSSTRFEGYVVKHARVKEAGIRVRQYGRCICLSVSDRGRGFDPQELTRTAGFGLLSIRERVELLGGRMKIKTAPGRGSTFSIVVPDGAEEGEGPQTHSLAFGNPEKVRTEEGRRLSPSPLPTRRG
jgi:PAS domain-containing protein